LTSGTHAITGDNTFYNLTANPGSTLTLPANGTQTISGAFSCTGTAGNTITINSSTSGTQSNLSKASGTVNCDYLVLQDNNATGGATWNAGNNSTAVSNVTGWLGLNVAPTFTSVSDDTDPVDVGSQITFTTVASDPDSGDTITLYVCKANDFTGSACGTGGEWCHSSASSSDPSCSHTILYTDGVGTKNYYAYIIDDSGWQASANPKSSTFTINNALPIASSASIDSGATSVILTESTTKNVVCTATVSDNNGYSDIATVTAKLYRSGVGASGGDDNANHYTLSGSTATYCSGSGTSGTCTFTFAVYYYADPTDAGSDYDAQNWVCQVTPSDGVGAGTANTDTIEMATLKSFSVTETINYGSLTPGQSTTGTHTATVTNTGNVATGFQVYGEDLSCSVRSSVPVNNQQVATSTFNYGSGLSLSGTPADLGASLGKPTESTPTVEQDTYWQVLIPAGTKGTCSGATSFIAN